LSRFRAEEELSQVHPYHVEALSNEDDLDFDKALGRNCTLTLITPEELERHFCGVLVEAELKGMRDDLWVYQLELRPWLWLLKHASSSKIFENQKAPDIIMKIFTDRGFTDFRSALTNNYPALQYCVQYNETDFDFVTRLMQKNGIYYFFEHTDGTHTLVLADSKSSHKPAPGVETLSYESSMRAGAGDGDKQGFRSWTKNRKFTTGRATLNANDYTKWGASLRADSDKSGDYGHGSLSAYSHTSNHKEQEEGERLAKVVIDARKAVDQHRTGHGQIPSLFPGCLVTLKGHPEFNENIEYLVQRCSHRFTSQGYRSWSGGVGGALGADFNAGNAGSAGASDSGVDDPYDGGSLQDYDGSAGMSASSQPYRAAQDAHTPKIYGVTVGMVCGNDEIDTDPKGLGTIKVELPLYEEGSNSFWAQTTQFWAGSGSRGALFLPRMGDEVVVAFEHGDPDHPIVIGSLYNSSNKPPETLPDNKNISEIRTRSTPSGGGGYHLLSFDDTTGSELMNIQAQKDLTILIKNNETRTVYKDQSETIQGNITKATWKNETETTHGTVTRTVDKTETVTATQGYSLTSDVQIVLTVGGSSITIDQSGITIHAPLVTINGDAMVSINGG
jgi:type VI secretion system secreted protein VgrG